MLDHDDAMVTRRMGAPQRVPHAEEQGDTEYLDFPEVNHPLVSIIQIYRDLKHEIFWNKHLKLILGHQVTLPGVSLDMY